MILLNGFERSFEQFASLNEEVQPVKRPKYAVSRMSYVADTDGAALDAMKMVTQHHRIFTHLFTGTAQVHGGFTVPDPVENEYSEERLLENLVAGSPDTCVEKLGRYEQLGVDHYIMYAGFLMDHTATMKSIELFAERVMPCFADNNQRYQ